MYYYSHDAYVQDLFKIKSYVENLIHRGHKVNIVAIHRGSLPMAVHLTNIIPGTQMSIIKFQTRDGNDKAPEWILNTSEEGDTMVVLDDIYDSGKTIKSVDNWLNVQYPDKYITSYVLFGKENNINCNYVREHDGSWIVFPWELDVDI